MPSQRTLDRFAEEREEKAKDLSSSAARTLVFTYGTLMYPPQMRLVMDNDAYQIGIGKLEGYKPVVSAIGYGSVEPHKRYDVFGVVWRISHPRYMGLLDKYETDAYIREELPITFLSGKRENAWVYSVKQTGKFGVLHEGVLTQTIAAAINAQLPTSYVEKVLIPSLAHGV